MVDGWGLLHSLLADVVADVVGAASKEAASATTAERDTWTLIASLAAEPARENCMGGNHSPVQLNPSSKTGTGTAVSLPACMAFGVQLSLPDAAVLPQNAGTQAQRDCTVCCCCKYCALWQMQCVARPSMRCASEGYDNIHVPPFHQHLYKFTK